MNPIVTKLVEDRAALELEDRHELLGREIRNIKQRATVRGALQSSGTVLTIQGAVAQEVRVRATLVWTALARALSSAREVLTDETAGEAKELIYRLVQEHSSDLEGHIDSAARLGLPGMRPDPLGAAFMAAFDRIDSEIDFALLAAAGGGSDTTPQVVNIYQSQGIVQTGFQASATMVISLSTEERREIKLALSSAREVLEHDTGLPALEKRQAIELLDETAAEVEKDEPNRLKIRSGLQGVAATVQAVAAAPHAYGFLKGAAALVGLDLP